MPKRRPHILRTRRLVIRPWTMADAPAMQKAVNFRAVTRMTAAMPFPYLLSDAKFWIKKTQRYFRQRPLQQMHLTITRDHEVIGSIGTHRHGDRAGLGYWLTPSVHGQGIMTEAVRAFVPFLFRTWPITKIETSVFLFNGASARVLEKCGFSKTALELHAICKNGKWLDVNVFTRYRKKLEVHSLEKT